jgi:hypothetical protein
VKATANPPNSWELTDRATRTESTAFVPLEMIWSTRFQLARPTSEVAFMRHRSCAIVGSLLYSSAWWTHRVVSEDTASQSTRSL